VLKLGVPRDELCTEIGLDRERIRAWATAFAVLSAWWCLEDGSDSWEYSLTCANLLVQS
jgi:streptomycin 6-kinase